MRPTCLFATPLASQAFRTRIQPSPRWPSRLEPVASFWQTHELPSLRRTNPVRTAHWRQGFSETPAHGQAHSFLPPRRFSDACGPNRASCLKLHRSAPRMARARPRPDATACAWSKLPPRLRRGDHTGLLVDHAGLRLSDKISASAKSRSCWKICIAKGLGFGLAEKLRQVRARPRIANSGGLAAQRQPDRPKVLVEIHREFITAAARWMMASKLWSVLSARMAIRLNSLSLQKKFSIK